MSGRWISFATLRVLGILSIAAPSAFAASFSRPTAQNAPGLFAGRTPATFMSCATVMD